MKVKKYTQSNESVEQQKAHARRKSRAKNYIWTKLKTEHREQFDQIIEHFNETQDIDLKVAP